MVPEYRLRKGLMGIGFFKVQSLLRTIWVPIVAWGTRTQCLQLLRA